MFFVYKNRFLARQIRNGHGFHTDNISAHVHLLEDNDPIKKTKMAAVSWVFSVWLIFHKNNNSVSAKIITGLSLSILSAEKSQNFLKFWCSFQKRR